MARKLRALTTARSITRMSASWTTSPARRTAPAGSRARRRTTGVPRFPTHRPMLRRRESYVPSSPLIQDLDGCVLGGLDCVHDPQGPLGATRLARAPRVRTGPLVYFLVFTEVTLADEGGCEFRSVVRAR